MESSYLVKRHVLLLKFRLRAFKGKIFSTCCWSTLVSRAVTCRVIIDYERARCLRVASRGSVAMANGGDQDQWAKQAAKALFGGERTHEPPAPHLADLAAEDQNRCSSVVVFTSRVRCGIAPRKLDPRAPLEPEWFIVLRSFLTPSITPQLRPKAAARANGGCPWTTMTNRQRTPRADPTPGSPCRP